MMKRQTWVLGNWKMNPATLSEADELATGIAQQLHADEALHTRLIKQELVLGIAPTHLHLHKVAQACHGLSVMQLAQDVSAESQSIGAFTGDVSAASLADLGVSAVLVGHSERRQYHHEFAELLAKKITHVVGHGMTVVYCVGESYAARESGDAVSVVKNQLNDVMDALELDSLRPDNFVVAYEPVWAIGTGLTASPHDAQHMHEAIRSTLAKHSDALRDSSILYGGSVKPTNADDFAACADVDGVLVGGASLSAKDFLDIARSFS